MTTQPSMQSSTQKPKGFFGRLKRTVKQKMATQADLKHLAKLSVLDSIDANMQAEDRAFNRMLEKGDGIPVNRRQEDEDMRILATGPVNVGKGSNPLYAALMAILGAAGIAAGYMLAQKPEVAPPPERKPVDAVIQFEVPISELRNST